MVGSGSQRRRGVLVTRFTVEKTTASSAGSNVAVRGWLGGLRLGLGLGHVSRATYAPGIILRTRKLGEDGSEGCTRENVLGRTREGIVPMMMVSRVLARIIV